MPEQVQAKRLMPNDRYAEMAVIGGLFIDDSVIDMIKDDLPG